MASWGAYVPMPVLARQLMLELLDQKGLRFDLIRQKPVHCPQFGGVFWRDTAVLQPRRGYTGSGQNVNPESARGAVLIALSDLLRTP